MLVALMVGGDFVGNDAVSGDLFACKHTCDAVTGDLFACKHTCDVVTGDLFACKHTCDVVTSDLFACKHTCEVKHKQQHITSIAVHAVQVC